MDLRKVSLGKWLLATAPAPILSLVVYHVHLRLIYEAVAIGDTPNGMLSPWHGAALTVLGFPMFYLWEPVGVWLKEILTDDGVIDLFAGINALFWGSILGYPLRHLFAGPAVIGQAWRWLAGTVESP
jgi:hypothetical protein